MSSQLPPGTAEVLLALDDQKWLTFDEVVAAAEHTREQVGRALIFLRNAANVRSGRIAVDGSSDETYTGFRLSPRGLAAANVHRRALKNKSA